MPGKYCKHLEIDNHNQPSIRQLGVGFFRFDLHLQKYWKVRHYLIEKEWLFHLTKVQRVRYFDIGILRICLVFDALVVAVDRQI